MKKIFFAILLMMAQAWAQSSGPNFPTTATGNTNASCAGTVSWAAQTNIEAADGAFATNGLGATQTTDDLIGEGFGFAIPGGTQILGILLEVNYKALAATTVAEHSVKILKAGVIQTAEKSTGAQLTTTATTVSYGGSSDLWGTTWSATDINNSTFGALTCYGSSPAGGTAEVDFFRITVTFSSGGSQMLKMFSQTSTPGGKPVTRELASFEFSDPPFEIKNDATKEMIHGHDPEQTINSHSNSPGDLREVASVNVFDSGPRSEFQGCGHHVRVCLPAYFPVAFGERGTSINDQVDGMTIHLGFDVDGIPLWSCMELQGECGRSRIANAQVN